MKALLNPFTSQPGLAPPHVAYTHFALAGRQEVAVPEAPCRVPAVGAAAAVGPPFFTCEPPGPGYNPNFVSI